MNESRPRPADTAPAWPEASQPASPQSWPEPTRPSWPEPPRDEPSRPHASRPARLDAGQQDTSWPEPPPPGPSWPEPPRQNGARPGPAREPSPQGPRDDPFRDQILSWPEPVPQEPPAPERVPAWAQPQTPSSDAWSNLSSPAPWPRADTADPLDRTMTNVPPVQPDPGPPGPFPPQGGPQQGAGQAPHQAPHQGPPQGMPPGQGMPDGRPMAPAHAGTPLGDQAVPSGPMGPGGPQQGDEQRPGSNLSRDPSDPDRPFVTAGQISGSRTPPPERQQELWDTVFGDNYEAMGEHDLDDTGKPVWVYALGGSVAIALVAALLWAFLAGPLASDDPPSGGTAAGPSSTSSPPPKRPTTIGALPKYPGKAAPVVGVVAVPAARVSLPKLGGDWQLDQRDTVKATYGFDVRQYVQVAPERYAQIMAGPLSQRLASYYQQDDLEPVIRQVVLTARKRFFPGDNTVKKIAQQDITVGGAKGRLIAYSLTSSTEKATLVTMAVNSGGDLPAIVYLSIPADAKRLLPDVQTVIKQLKVTG
ncbi:hypothetical protein AB0L05_20445 [Nonomuraea pusilla]|uniref:hypothetical protein n=1 Tax=Nonomuraea pusilla TaxID=46177 RepID=UPI00332A702C